MVHHEIDECVSN